jgi:hypothetical protein
MGVDALIYIHTTDGQDPSIEFGLPPGVESVRRCDNDDFLADAIGEHCGVRPTHEVRTGWRHYGPGYERGPWPDIAAVLMRLMQAPNVDIVWYDGDSGWELARMDASRLLEITTHWLANGTQPYSRLFEEFLK